MKRKLFAIVMCISLLGTLLTGCGADNKTEDTSTNTSSEEVNKTIKIGVAAPITGNYAEYGIGFQIATDMAVNEINEAGGINGRDLEIKIMDSKGDAKEATAISRQFSDDEEIMAVVGDFSSTCCMATAPIYEEAGLLQLSPTASNPNYAGMNKYMFGIMGRQDAEGPFVAKYLLGKYLKSKKVAVIYLNNDWGVAAKNYLIEQAAEEGIDVVAEENHVDGEKDFTGVLTKVQQANPDTICLVTFYNECAIIANQIKQMGWDVKITALGPGASEQIIELGGENVEGFLTSTPFFAAEDDPKGGAFKKAFEEKAGYTLNVHSACAYDAVYMLAEAMKNCDEITRDNIRDELQGLKGFNGVTGPLEFSQDGDLSRKYLIVGIENGKWTVKEGYDYYDE
ncbi:ABC transporter substrate-binding protein [Clostridium sediminicola]|uniref:ABC transporter substrate-binding protein n=1 Tax=Clostridium sediminicola TaxID=3114879 RepID=UPI0031F1FBBA